MKISGSSWENYINRLRKVNDKAAEKMVEYLETHEIVTQDDRKQMLDYAYALATYYGEGAAELACQMYDAAATAQGAKVPPAEPAETATYGETAKAVQGAMKQSDDPNVTGSAVGRLVKQAGVDTTMKNAIRDGAEWAWIPSGDTCAFCLTLASRGFQKASKKVLKGNHAEHIHANCDCTFFIRFDGKSTIEGYDPEKLLSDYYAADGKTSQEKINSLRREQYQLNKDQINAQKRAAYEKRKVGEAIETLKKDHNVVVDISKAKDQTAAAHSVEHLLNLVSEYKNTLVSYSIVDATRSPSAKELGSAYMLNGRTNIQVLNKALRAIKATDEIGAGDKQPLVFTYHEFAHALSQSREKMDLAFWKEMRKLKREYDNQINSPDWFSKLKITSYAAKDVDEFMAECFAQAKLSENPSPYAVRALEIIDRHFKK